MRWCGAAWAANGMERCIRNLCNALRCSAEFLHSAQQKQTFKFQTMETGYENLRFRSKNSLQLTWSTIDVSSSNHEEIFVSAQQKEHKV